MQAPEHVLRAEAQRLREVLASAGKSTWERYDAERCLREIRGLLRAR